MARKILFCATVDYHFKAFHLAYLKWFKDRGWQVHVAANGTLELPYVDQKHTIPIHRRPFKLDNIKAWYSLKSIVEENDYDIIHCHTPMGGLLGRLVAGRRKCRHSKVMYTAHGFHFYTGAPKANWLLYYPMERWLSRYTDCLVTISSEDYHRATQHRFKAGAVEHVHGVGVDTNVFKPVDDERKLTLRRRFGFHSNDFLMFFAGEFNKNKNQQVLIKAVASLREKIPSTRLLLAGEGPLQKTCSDLADTLSVGHMVKFLGFRKDVRLFLQMSDVAVAASFREGLPVNVLEAMACGLPLVVSRNRGHNELVTDGVNGFVVSPCDHTGFADRINELYEDAKLRRRMAEINIRRVKLYSQTRVLGEMASVYARYLGEG